MPRRRGRIGFKGSDGGLTRRRDQRLRAALQGRVLAGYGRNGGITAVTFYDGEAVAAAAYVKGKLREVLEANPWIAGQLVKQALVHLKAGVCIRRRPLVHPKADHKHSPRPSESCRVKSWLM